MVEQSIFNPSMTSAAVLSVQDLLYEGRSRILSDYLSLSISLHDTGTKICITTTDAKPVTYCAIIPATSTIDLPTLRFVAAAGTSVV